MSIMYTYLLQSCVYIGLVHLGQVRCKPDTKVTQFYDEET